MSESIWTRSFETRMTVVSGWAAVSPLRDRSARRRGGRVEATRWRVASLALLSSLLLGVSASAGTSVALELREHELFEAHLQGLGRDLRIATYEQFACIDRDLPDFDLLTFEARAPDVECDPRNNYNGYHSTRTALALASARSDGQGGMKYRGPFAARVFDVDSEFYLEVSDLLARDPDFVSISEVGGPSSSLGMDALVYEHRIFVANGAGNDDKVARCRAYNALCVGGYSDGGTESWADDSVAGGSWQNHSATGREEPDLAGPWKVAGLPDGGTSYATPAVVGLAALLTANHREVLYREPTLMRALLMASASHAVREPAKLPGIPIVGDGVDDHAGAGVPRGDRASAIVEAGRTFAQKLDRARDFDAGGRLGDQIRFQVAKGDVVRAVLAWDNCPISQIQGEFDALVVDLDLTVRGPEHDAHDDILCCADVNLSSTQVDPTSATATNSGDMGPLEATEVGSEGYDPNYSSSFQSLYDLWRSYVEAGQLLSQFDFLDMNARDAVADVSDGVATGIEVEQPPLDFQEVPTVFTNHSRVDNYEMVEFRAPVGGTYEIEVDARRWDVCPYDGGMSTHTALAWDVRTP